MGLEESFGGDEHVGESGDDNTKVLDLISDEENYTTGEVREMTGMCGRTIRRCFDDGYLRGFMIPGSNHRRIPGKYLREFVEEYSTGEYGSDSGLVGKKYTTGQAAKICNVSLQTINRNIDERRLEGVRLPGSSHRRISYGALYGFLVDFDIPLNGLADSEGVDVDDLPVPEKREE
jgi:excisionase family DNA binding protein